MALASEPRDAGSSADPDVARSEEAALIREAAAGDTQAFGEIVHTHHRRVFNFLSHLYIRSDFRNLFLHFFKIII